MWCSTDFNDTEYKGYFNTTANDIIILQLDSPLRITEKVQPACLPPDDLISDSPSCPGYCNGITNQHLSCYYTGWNLINKRDNILRYFLLIVVC